MWTGGPGGGPRRAAAGRGDGWGRNTDVWARRGRGERQDGGGGGGGRGRRAGLEVLDVEPCQALSQLVSLGLPRPALGSRAIAVPAVVTATAVPALLLLLLLPPALLLLRHRSARGRSLRGRCLRLRLRGCLGGAGETTRGGGKTPSSPLSRPPAPPMPTLRPSTAATAAAIAAATARPHHGPPSLAPPREPRPEGETRAGKQHQGAGVGRAHEITGDAGAQQPVRARCGPGPRRPCYPIPRPQRPSSGPS